jgi:hypothetical protein
MIVELQFMDQNGVVIHERGAFDYDRFVPIPSPGDVVRLINGQRWKVLERIFDYVYLIDRRSGVPDVRVSFRCETV